MSSLQIDLAEDKAIFKSVIESYCTAWTNSDGVPDWESLAKLYADDSGLIFYDDSADFQGYRNVQDMQAVYPDFAELVMISRDDLRTFRRGDLVWTVNLQDVHVCDRVGNRTSSIQRQTAIWEERNGAWVMLYERLATPLLAETEVVTTE